ncbi:hypothetical protein ACFQVD_17490 [Streptosporangium amethystogenes subsp. fukuiense]|uniref:Uncharacterized protein n=1 Tax=Streptosporangium amethystogenes subsp. fukuiense TaxID=698418 RepID=A0ABW2T1P7_9ACTN
MAGPLQRRDSGPGEMTDVAPVLGLLTLTMTNLYCDQHGDVTEYAVDFLAPERELSADYDLE